MSDNATKCANCAFYVEGELQVDLQRRPGQCQYNPPVVVPMLGPQGTALASTFPTVAPEAFCSKWTCKAK